MAGSATLRYPASFRRGRLVAGSTGEASGMQSHRKYVSFRRNIVMLGFGSIGQAMLPLLLRHIDISPAHIRIISRSPDRTGIAAEFGVAFTAQPLRQDDYREILDEHLERGD